MPLANQAVKNLWAKCDSGLGHCSSEPQLQAGDQSIRVMLNEHASMPLNNMPVIAAFSKHQNTVVASTFGAELLIVKIVKEIIVAPWSKFLPFGVVLTSQLT